MTNQTVLATTLPVLDLIDVQKHPNRFLNKKLISRALIFLPLLLGVGVLFFMTTVTYGFLGLALWVLLLLVSLFISYQEYFIRGYILREHDITYRHGWIFQHQLTVPFNRIQHTEINHGPVDRFFNLCELEIYTAGGASSDLIISGLDPDDAARIKEFISSNVVTHD
jgi:hypothetical protein